MKYTTLNKIMEYEPCSSGWNKLLKHLGKTKADDEPLPFAVILKSNGLDDALWCCRSAPEYDREWRLFAVWCAQQVMHLNNDPRVAAAIKVAEDFANGQANQRELAAAGDAAWAARGDAWVAAWEAARAAAWEAAWEAARAAAWEAAWAAARGAAWATAGDAARATAGDAARAAQSEVFLWVVNGGLTAWEKAE